MENPALTEDEQMRIALALIHHPPDLDVFILDISAAVAVRQAHARRASKPNKGFDIINYKGFDIINFC